MAALSPANVGELTFQLTRDCMQYLGGAQAFDKYAEVVAALECAKMEFYARVVRPYEDRKCEQNGDCYV